VVVIQIKSEKEIVMEERLEKSVFLTARAIPEEKKALEAIAKRERLTTSEALRLIVREAAKARGLWIERELHAWER
jgi:antitoxin component of RelBE/YafQ-DinJ toxin-antitoxin module